MGQSQSHPALPKRLSVPFNAAMMIYAQGAAIDLTDPLRTNVKFSLGGTDMYADLNTLISMREDGHDKSGVASLIVEAWEKALMGNTHGSNSVTLRDGILRIRIFGLNQNEPVPNRARMM